MDLSLQVPGSRLPSSVPVQVYSMCLSTSLVQWLPEVMLHKVNAGTKENKWKPMMPLESFSLVLACCHLYPHFIGQHNSHGQIQHQWCGKIYSATIVDVTVKSYGKGSGYIILILSGHEELRITIYSTTVPLLSIFCIPLTCIIYLLSHQTCQSLIQSEISFLFVLNLFLLDWEDCEFKEKWFPLTNPACNDGAGTA